MGEKLLGKVRLVKGSTAKPRKGKANVDENLPKRITRSVLKTAVPRKLS